MTDLQIEQQILQFITNKPSYTMFLLKQEFKPRQYEKVKAAVDRLIEAKKIRLDDNLFFKPVLAK